jgi:hypothetical protein
MLDDSLSLFVQYVNCDLMNCIKSHDEQNLIGSVFINYGHAYTGVPLYPRVIRFKTYHGCVKPWIILNAMYNVIFV